MPDIKFKVKLLDQSVQELDLDDKTLFSDVKLVLEALTNIPATRQRLIYRGRVLRDDSSLQEQGVEDGQAIHLIEREAPAAAAGGASRAAAGTQAAPDFNSLLQGVFSALGGLGQSPAAAAAAGHPAQGPEPVHLLQSIASFLQQLQGEAPGAAGATAMPVTSLALGGTTGTQQLQNALTAALRNILAGQALSAGQQAQLAAAASTAAASGAGAATGTAGTYPHMQLVLAALGLLLTRTQMYLSGPLASGLIQGAQQLAALAQQQGVNTAEASQALAAVSGQLQSAAALLVELARAASASSVELQGSNPLLTANTAAVLQPAEGSGARLTPAFPTLYPQLPEGMGGDRNAAGRPLTQALPDFSNPADVLQFAGRLTNTVLTGLGTGIPAGATAPAAGSQQPADAGAGATAAGAAHAAAAAAAGGAAAAAAPSNAQVAQMVAAALTSSLAPVIERVSADVAGAVRTSRDSVASGQFQTASTTAATLAASTVSGTVSRVLTSVTDTLNRNLGGIEQRLQEVEREQGRQVNAIDIAAAVQHVLLPHMQPLGDVLGAAARAAASSAAAANQAAATAATAAQEAANAAAAAGQAAAAAAGAGAAPQQAPAASAPSAPPAPAAAAAAADEAGPSSSTGGGQPRGLGLGTGLRAGALPAKRKAQGAAGADTAAAGSSSGAAAGTAAAGGSSGAASSAAASRAAAGGPAAPGAAGRGAPPPDLGALMQMMMGGAGAGGSSGQSAGAGGAAGGLGRGGAPGVAGGGELTGLMQMMGGMLGGGGGPGGGGAGAGGGMGGLLQMAGQIASDPAMQPLMSGLASAMLGGGGGGAGGGAGGLGGLLGGLLGPGGMGAMGGGGPGGSGARSATVVASMDDLEHELPPDAAAEWRRLLDEDARAQAVAAAQGRGSLSEVYQAGAPTAAAGRRGGGLIPGLPV